MSAASAQQASTFQDSCQSVQYTESVGVGSIGASCRTQSGSYNTTVLQIRGIENTDGDLTHTSGGALSSFAQICRNMSLVAAGPSNIMLVGDCQRRDGSWVGTSTQIWNVDNNNGVLQY